MSFDVRTYRRRVQRWREIYAGITDSIRVLKMNIAAHSKVNSNDAPGLQRALTVLQDEARALMEERQMMKDYWHMHNTRLPVDIYLGVVILT